MPESAIIAITLIAIALIIGMTLNGIVGKVMDGKRARHETKAGPQGQDLREIADRQAAIEERLRVLERIATDRGTLIADEIEALRIHVAPLGPGDVFGERGMLTGEPRSASVFALSDLECYRLDKAGFEGVIHARPDIAHEISRILESRAAELDARRAAVAIAPLPPTTHVDLLARIRSFFGLHGNSSRESA